MKIKNSQKNKLDKINKTDNKLDFYRSLLIVTAAAYIIFALVYRITAGVTDPMSAGERIISSLLILTVLFLSYNNQFVQEKIEIITFFLSFFAILQLFYYNHQFAFKLELSITVIIIIAVFNLIFNLNKIKFYINLLLIILISFSLYLSNPQNIINSLYLTAYIIIAFLSFYISYYIERSQKRSKKNLKRLISQHQFQKKLAKISSDLVDLGLENIDQKIQNSLKEIGKYFNIDRSYIFEINKKEKLMSNTYEWTARGINSEKANLQNLKTENYQWWLKNIKNKELIIIKNVSQLGKEAAAEKKLLESQNIKSLIVFPIYIKEELTGFFGFDLVENKLDFNRIKLEQLKIFTDVITNALSRHKDNLKIKRLSYYDSLTEIYNRRFFEEELKRLDTTRQLPISIIVADLNGLKIINDSYGHKMGDYLLKRSAKLIKNSIRKEDILARQGGDEFIILLPQTEAEAAAKIIQRIKDKTGIIKGTSIPLSIALGQSTKNDENEDIEDVIKEADNQMYKNKLSESRSSKSNIVEGLINALEAKSNETKEHALRMKNTALNFAKKLNLSESKQNRLTLLAALHDIGKINISEEILNKPDKLNQKEWEIIKKHTEQGYKIASSSQEFAAVAEDIFSHHERWDGSGYPRQLKGEEIPYLARIISLVDAYDVMTNDRAYSAAVSKEEALAEIRRCSGTQFDPDLAEKFIDLLEGE